MGNERAKRMGASRQISVPMIDPAKLTLVYDKKHPLYDPRVEWPVNEKLVCNMVRTKRVRVPLHVRENGKKEDGTINWEVVEGRQRVKACIEANRRLVEAGEDPIEVMILTEKGDEDKLLADVVISLNEHRVGNTPMYRAKMVLRLEEKGYSKADIADIMGGVTTQTIDGLLNLFKLSKKWQNAVDSGQVTIDLSKSVINMPREEQDEALDKLLEGGGSLKGKKGRAKLANATSGKVGGEEGPMSKKEILKELEGLEMTIKAQGNEAEADLISMRNTIQFLLRIRKRRPWAIVEVTTPEEPAKRRGRGKKGNGSSTVNEDGTNSYDHSAEGE
jgi:ParB family chromosome partitioning protein